MGGVAKHSCNTFLFIIYNNTVGFLASYVEFLLLKRLIRHAVPYHI